MTPRERAERAIVDCWGEFPSGHLPTFDELLRMREEARQDGVTTEAELYDAEKTLRRYSYSELVRLVESYGRVK
jgi:hypothetical protein